MGFGLNLYMLIEHIIFTCASEKLAKAERSTEENNVSAWMWLTMAWYVLIVFKSEIEIFDNNFDVSKCHR